jgi:hypothetical protein
MEFYKKMQNSLSICFLGKNIKNPRKLGNLFSKHLLFQNLSLKSYNILFN